MSKSRENTTPGQETYIPYLKITPSYICAYSQYNGERRNVWQTHTFRNSNDLTPREIQESEQKRYTGEITKSARKKLQSACDILFALANKKKVWLEKKQRFMTYRIGFITLTLSAPQGIVTDREIKENLLQPFLRHFKRQGLHNYIWKAERQQNGNIHFHIFTDCWIDKTDVRDYWNQLQNKYGYTQKFRAKFGHSDPNSTDTKAVREEKGMVTYMLKYFLKPVEKGSQMEIGRDTTERATGKIWDCSINLKMRNDTADVAEDWQFELISREEEKNNLKKIQTDHCCLWFPTKSKIWKASPSFIAKRLTDFLAKVRAKGREPDQPTKNTKFQPD